MLEQYKDIYPEFYQMITSNIKKNQITHAYLIETNSLDAFDIAVNIAKEILYRELNEKERDTINKLIDFGNYPDLKIVDADGLWIKKEQILELQETLKTKSIYSNKRIYIIKDASKLNKSSANTLLKFLEEPNEDIIAILLTKNKYAVIETIISRCQNIHLISKVQIKEINNDKKEQLLAIIKTIEEYKEKAIAFSQSHTKNIKDKENLTELLNNMLLFYEDVLSVTLKRDIKNYKKEEIALKEIASYNNIEELSRKINAIAHIIENSKYNLNLKLTLDKLIILMTGAGIDV